MGERFSVNGSTNYAEGSVVSKTILNQETGTITLFAFDKGQSLSEHTAPFNAVANITDGTADIVIGGKSNLLSAGESIVMPANVPHAVKAVEKFKMMLVMIKGK